MALVARSLPPAPVTTGAPAGVVRRVSFYAMGTPCEIQFVSESDTHGQEFERTAVGWVTEFEAKYSRFRSDSLVSRINAAAGVSPVPIDEETEALLKLCDSLYFTTQGILDPTLLPLLRLWDYKATAPVLPSDLQIDAARKLVGWPKVQRHAGTVLLPERGMALDFGGFGKEYAVDVVAQLAQRYGIQHVLVDFGHDIRVLGQPPGRPAWHVGLEDPRNPGATNGSVALGGNRGIASSGDYMRRLLINGRRYGHIVDPRTGWPVSNGTLQATVVAGTCLQAGVLSTTAFVLGVPKAIEFIQSFPGAEGLLVTERARAQTRGFFNYVVTP